MLDKGKQFVARTRDRRYGWVRNLALVLSLLLVVIALMRIPGNDWGLRFMQGWYHVFAVAWFCVLSYNYRTAGSREIVRLWITGFSPVALITYALTEPIELWIGTGNLQTAVWVPIVEELVKILPLVLWTTLVRPKQRHGSLSGFWVLGFAVGAGFSFHEDALYGRLVASGFQEGLTGVLFPIFLVGGQLVITHAGWTALAGVAVGVVSLYRSRMWAWILGGVLLAVPVLDHMAVNWRAGGGFWVRLIVANGHHGIVMLTATAVLVIVHDWLAMRWTNKRDRLFPSPGILGDITALRRGSVADRIGTLLNRRRYRRFRNAAFIDLYRARTTGASAGDRRKTIAQLRSLERKSS